MTGQKKHDYLDIIDQITDLSKAFRKGPKAYEQAIEGIRDLFLKDCAEILFWLESEVTAAELRDLLDTRVQTHYTEYMTDANSFRTLAKFPPAFGLMGTTVGMIALLQSIGGEGSNNIGPAMAIALLTTLYGLIVANIFFLPIAENLHKLTMDDYLARKMIVDGVMLIQANKPTKFIEERVKSYLIPSKRVARSKRK